MLGMLRQTRGPCGSLYGSSRFINEAFNENESPQPIIGTFCIARLGPGPDYLLTPAFIDGVRQRSFQVNRALILSI